MVRFELLFELDLRRQPELVPVGLKILLLPCLSVTAPVGSLETELARSVIRHRNDMPFPYMGSPVSAIE